MAHYAVVDENNIVTRVFVGKDESSAKDWEAYYSNLFDARCLRTSYNTYQGRHRLKNKLPFRGNYAGRGYSYNEELDAFIRPQPYPSWTLNKRIFDWDPPKPFPNDDKYYEWDEDIQDWVAE